MKTRTTQKQVNYSYAIRIQVPYCELQTLLSCEEPTYCTAGVYGWNADIYHCGGGVAIVTGYRPYGNLKPAYELCREYEEKAREIVKATSDYTERREKLAELIQDFVMAVRLAV